MTGRYQFPVSSFQSTNRTRVGAAVLGLTLLVAACGDDTADTTSTTTTTGATETTAATTTTTAATTTTTAATTTEATTTTVAGPVIGVTETGLGPILTDPDGMTLYLLTDDQQGASQCSGGCASTWPPLVDEVGAGEGVDAALLGTVARPDGTTQVTYNGWPLYGYAGDAAPGDTNGQGIGGRWFVVSPEGEPVDG